MSLPSKALLISSVGTWDESFSLANNIIAQMTLDEKLGVVIGTGQLNSSRMFDFTRHI
jgi:hypothetical protein